MKGVRMAPSHRKFAAEWTGIALGAIGDVVAHVGLWTVVTRPNDNRIVPDTRPVDGVDYCAGIVINLVENVLVVGFVLVAEFWIRQRRRVRQ
jgi:hypothetical protein